MRCASCGTDNAPDSRFCGGCGARMAAAEPRLAPTAKILDDSSFPGVPTTPRAAALGAAPILHGPASMPPAMPTPAPGAMVRPPSQPAYGSIPPTNPQRAVSIPPTNPQRPASSPPTSQRPASLPPTAQPVRARTPASSMADSIAIPPRRPLGLIAVVLIADLGLAAAGAVLLAKGLAKNDAKATAVPTAPTMGAPPPNAEPRPQKSQAPAPASPVQAAVAEPIPAVDTSNRVAAPRVAAASAARDARERTSGKSAKPTSGSTSSNGASSPSGPVTSPTAASATSPGGAAGPEDPYAAPTGAIAAELDRRAATSQAAFDRCLGAAAPVHGSIQIAFQVLANGRVANVAAVENSTGNAELARCLAKTITSWRMSAHEGRVLEFVRPFNYP